MNPKERFRTSLQCRQPDDMVSFMELEFHLYRELTGKEPVTGYAYAKLSRAEQDRALRENAELMVQTAELCGHDAIKDIGGYWELFPGEPAALWFHDEETRLAQIRALRAASGGRHFILGSTCATMAMPDSANIEEYVYDLFENREEVLARNEKMLVGAIEIQSRLLDAGADGIVNACDVAYNSGPFLSPAMMDDFFFPFFNRWTESLSSQGIPSVWHSDGNLKPLLPRVLESGLTALQCVDPMAGMDIVEIKKQVYPKLTLIGNLDCGLLHQGPADQITAEAKRIIEGCKDGGGFVLCGCNAIFKGIPAENYRLFCDARVSFGRF